MGQLFIIGLTYLGLSSSASGAVEDKSCLELMKVFIQKTKNTPTEPTVEVQDFPYLEKIIHKNADELELTEDEQMQLTHNLKELNFRPKKSEFESYIYFISTLNEKERMLAIKDMSQLKLDEPDSEVIKRFKGFREKIGKGVKKKQNKITEKIKRENPSWDSKRIRREVKKQSDDFYKDYQKRFMGCRSKKWTPERKQAAVTFRRFTVGIGVTSSVGAYYYHNRDREMDGSWWGQLGYEMGVGTLFGSIKSRIISNPVDSVYMKAAKKYLFSRGSGLIDMAGFSYLFGASESEADDRLSEIMNDPKRKKELLKLKKRLEDPRFFQEFKSKFFEILSPFSGEVGIENKEINVQEIDWENLTSEDLENEGVREVVLAAVMAELYEENKGQIIQTGDVGADRYAFHALYGLIMIPKDMFTSLYIYNVLCMGQNNPKMALLKAVGIYTVNKLIFDQLYYFSRRTSINQ